MKKVLLFGPEDRITHTEPQHVSRRGFMTLMSAGAVFTALGLHSDSTQAAPLVPSIVSAILGFLGSVVSGQAINKLQNAVQGAQVRIASPSYNFHGNYAPRLELVGVHLPPLQSKYGYWLALNGFLRADSQSPPRHYKDLNEYEMHRLVYEEPQYGAVLHPCDYRLQPTASDTSQFERVCSLYKTTPERLTLEYKRPFSYPGRQGPAWGFGVASRTDTTKKDLLIDV